MEKARDWFRRSAVRWRRKADGDGEGKKAPELTDLRLLMEELDTMAECHSTLAESGARAAADLLRWCRHLPDPSSRPLRQTAELVRQLLQQEQLSRHRLAHQLRSASCHVLMLIEGERRLSLCSGRRQQCRRKESRIRRQLRSCSSPQHVAHHQCRLAVLERDLHVTASQLEECAEETAVARLVRVNKLLDTLSAGNTAAANCSQLVYAAVAAAAADLTQLEKLQQLSDPYSGDGCHSSVQGVIDYLLECQAECVCSHRLCPPISLPAAVPSFMPPPYRECSGRASATVSHTPGGTSRLYPNLGQSDEVCTCSRGSVSRPSSCIDDRPPTAPSINQLYYRLKSVRIGVAES